MYGFRIATTLALTAVAQLAAAGVTRIEILERVPFAGGQAFGAAGAYERIRGRFHGELDPNHPLNRGIADLALAPRNERGRVEYAADLEILAPADPSRGNGTLLYDVNNRGNKVAIRTFNLTTANNALDRPEHAGDGFLFRQGFTILWSGWIPHTMLGPAPAVRYYPPVVEGLTQLVWDEFLFNDARQTTARLTFRAASTDKSRATLMVRARNDDTPSVIQPGAWEFGDNRSIRLLPRGTPFAAGQLYQLAYTAIDAPVAGAAFATTRDIVAHLRAGRPDAQGNTNPIGPVRATLAFGSSQSGRFLREFVYQGFNESEEGAQVFDGIHPHIASQRIFLNWRFAQPNRLYSAGYSFLGFPDTGFPYAYATQQDALSDRRDGLLARCSARKNCPKIVHTITATEYWQGGQSLGTTDVAGTRDVALPDNVRMYHLAGSQHIEFATMGKNVCVGAPNTAVDPRPVLRALLLALDRWVKDGTAPPASRYPRIADGTLVPLAKLALPANIVAPREPNPILRFDYGKRVAQGIIDNVPPRALARRPGVLVPQVDADGNETAGVRMPEQSVPLATTTGWALRGTEAGAAGELCYLDGFQLPFQRTAAERDKANDPRRAIDERYKSAEDYAERIRAAADALVRDGLLLVDDAARSVTRARAVKW